MSTLTEAFRAKAHAAKEGSIALIDTLESPTKNVVMAIVGQVNGAMYTALADMLDFEAAQPAAVRAERLADKLKKFSAEQDAIRKAAPGAPDVEWNRVINPSATQPNAEPVAGGVG